MGIFLHGQFMRISLAWKDRIRLLTIRLKNGSKALPPWPRTIRVRIAGEQETRSLVFDGLAVKIAFPRAVAIGEASQAAAIVPSG